MVSQMLPLNSTLALFRIANKFEQKKRRDALVNEANRISKETGSIPIAYDEFAKRSQNDFQISVAPLLFPVAIGLALGAMAGVGFAIFSGVALTTYLAVPALVGGVIGLGVGAFANANERSIQVDRYSTYLTDYEAAARLQCRRQPEITVSRPTNLPNQITPFGQLRS